jgi:signal transduction histidine kinase
MRPKPDPILVVGQKHSLVQVFVNLFMNALYVMPTGGSLELKVESLSDWVQVSVHDSGPGIPEDILPRVTEALFTTKGSEGSGLGLAICKEIIEIEHEGELVVRNHPQGGAEILVRLPQVRPGSKK